MGACRGDGATRRSRSICQNSPGRRSRCRSRSSKRRRISPETGDYLYSLTIFEHGVTEIKKKNAKLDEGASSTPCFKPDDLYSHHARATMARILAKWLARHKLTPTEFIHTLAALEKFFEATGGDDLSARDPEGRGSPGIRVRIVGGADRQASERALHDCDSSRLQGRASRPFSDARSWTIRSPSRQRLRTHPRGALHPERRAGQISRAGEQLGQEAAMSARSRWRNCRRKGLRPSASAQCDRSPGLENARQVRRLWQNSSARTLTSATR